MTGKDAVPKRNEGTDDIAIGTMRTAISDTGHADIMTTMMMTAMTEGAATADTDPRRDRKVAALPAVRAARHLLIEGVVYLLLALMKDHDLHITGAATDVHIGMIGITLDAHLRHDIASPDENTENHKMGKTAMMTPQPDLQLCSKTRRSWTRFALHG